MGVLDGKVALVTGGARGVGRGIAVELARAGADVCVNDLTSAAEEGASTVAELAAMGRRGRFAACDVRDRGAVQDMVRTCEQTLGPIDILVSNAVTSERHSLLETSVEELTRAVEVSIYGAFHVMQVVARQMVREGRQGSLIQITSPFARLPYRAAIDYTVGKAGAHMMALAAANELAWHGIRVNLIEPGWTDTQGEHRWFDDSTLARAAGEEPLRRLALPEDIGRAAVFLASEPYVVGAVLLVDGGHATRTLGPAGEDPRRRPAFGS